MPAAPATTRFEGIDPQTELPAEYFAYKDKKGREVLHGVYILRHENGLKYVEAEFVHGKLEGRCRMYGDNGKLVYDGYCRADEPWEGTFTTGHEGRLYAKGKWIAVLLED